MKKYILSFISCLPVMAFAQSDADVLQKKLNNIHSMTASFNQVVRAKARVISRSSGKMALKRPGQFLWDTLKPMKQKVIADGNKMWVYDVELEQVTVQKQKKSLGGTAALFLSGYDETVARDYEVSLKKSAQGNERFDMKARKPRQGFQRVVMTFKADKLVGMELYDQLGQKTTVDLSQVNMNPEVNSKLFQFKPPKGVDVVQQ